MVRAAVTQPPPPANWLEPGRPEPILVSAGDISCTQHRVITPNGSFPLAGTTWLVSNNSVTTESMPTYAVVLAVIFFIFCLLGLLFLLIKERRTTGYVQVTVQGPGVFHSTQLPVSSPAQVLDIEQRVNYIRGLVASYNS